MQPLGSYIADTVSIKDTKKGGLFMARKKKEIKTETSIKKEDIEIMSLDNKPVNKEVTKESINIPNKFVKITSKPIISDSRIKMRNGRVYKELGNGMAMWSDTGEVFRI